MDHSVRRKSRAEVTEARRAERLRREAEALRANLRRRKQQDRMRDPADDPASPPAGTKDAGR
jgi:hypothetical protein